MIELYTIGFSEKSAEHFFELLRTNGIQLLIDVRLKNTSQMAGFSKKDDLKYFLKTICNCNYLHIVEFAPTEDLLKGYKDKKISWNEYENQYVDIIKKRDVISTLIENHTTQKVCFLCSEHLPDKCHRRLLAEMIAKKNEPIKHLV
ncbi:MAG: DUF488 domain-containing protein [Lachnoclostridium sp.]|jgi:uncharacterized protein (DUF488 family)|nr:DUF488 domain-containing protein [Lachnoclostridium sp.]